MSTGARKRGRPPKKDHETSSSHSQTQNDQVTSAGSRKRGRPPKEKLDTSLDNDTSKARRGRPPGDRQTISLRNAHEQPFSQRIAEQNDIAPVESYAPGSKRVQSEQNDATLLKDRTSGLLIGRVAIVTGGVTGIGRAIALEYIRQGACVTVNFLPDKSSEGSYASLQRECDGAGFANRLHGVAGDISRPQTSQDMVQQTVEKFGKVDVFVSNAGVCQFADFLDIEPTLLDNTISTNLSGAFYAAQASARQMVRQGTGGAIIGVASISALVGGGAQTHYTPTKAGVLSLMQSCAVALGRHGIRCNALLPGTIRTGLNEADLADEGKRRRLEQKTCLGRLGIPEDMAGPAVFLASDMAGYVTGAQLLVDGGMFVNLQ